MTAVHAQKGKNEILWDTYGVSHIYANAIQEMYYGFGWSQMHNRANLILKLYGPARGRAAEYWEENYIASDTQIRLFEIPPLACSCSGIHQLYLLPGKKT